MECRFLFINRCPLLPFLLSFFLNTQPYAVALHLCKFLICHSQLPAALYKLLKKLSSSFVTSVQSAPVTQNLLLFCTRFALLLPVLLPVCYLSAWISQFAAKEEPKSLPTQELLLSAHLCLPPQNLSMSQGRQINPLFFSSVPQNNFPSTSPANLLPPQTHGVSEAFADLRNSMWCSICCWLLCVYSIKRKLKKKRLGGLANITVIPQKQGLLWIELWHWSAPACSGSTLGMLVLGMGHMGRYGRSCSSWQPITLWSQFGPVPVNLF